MSTDTRTRFATILAELSDASGEHSAYALATLADCYSPDSIDSPGAAFLACIARDVAEFVADDADGARDAIENVADWAHGIADSAVPVYTHDRWQTFVDLGAYNEDPAGELGDDGSDLTQTAGVALYLIAERLVRALADELSEALDEDTDED